MEITMKTFHDEKENSVTKSRGTLQAVCPDDPSEISINRQRSPNLARRTQITFEKVMAFSSRVVVRYKYFGRNESQRRTESELV